MFKKIKKFINKVFIKPTIKIEGKNNQINFGEKTYFRKFRINIFGNNNKIIIKDNVLLHNAYIKIGNADCPIENTEIIIDEKTSANGLKIELGESNSKVYIGKECMISFNVELYCSDTHSIIDKNGNLLNYGESIEIGNHVWIGQKSTIMKNAKIPDNCIIASNSIVTKKFTETNCILAGIPAKIVKKEINWLRERPDSYIKKTNKKVS